MDTLFDDVESIILSSPGVETIGISIAQGAPGARGSKLFVNPGHPQQLTSEIDGKYYLFRDPGELLQLDDMYWRTDAARAYQFRTQPAGPAWVEISGSVIPTASPEIDFSVSMFHRLSITADTTFSTTGLAPGLFVEILVSNITGSTFDLTFPAEWMWVTYKPVNIQPNQRFLLQLKSFGETDVDVVADASASTYLHSVPVI